MHATQLTFHGKRLQWVLRRNFPNEWPGSWHRATPPGPCAGAASSRACAEASPRDRRRGKKCSRCRLSSPSRQRRTGGTPRSNAPRCPASKTAASSCDRRTKHSPCRPPPRKRPPRARLAADEPRTRGGARTMPASGPLGAPTPRAAPQPPAASSPWTGSGEVRGAPCVAAAGSIRWSPGTSEPYAGRNLPGLKPPQW